MGRYESNRRLKFRARRHCMLTLPRSLNSAPKQSLRQWLKVACADAASTLESNLRPAPHLLAFGAVGVSVRLSDVDAIVDLVPDALLPDTVVKAVRPRRLAFVAGRLSAEYAANRFGALGAVDIGSGGEPVWPSGLTGSITHDSHLATSVVARYANVVGVGIDSEIIAHGETRQAIEAVCCTEWERKTWIAGAPDGKVATAMFSAKEALYKAIYPSVQRFVDFLEVEVTELDVQQRLLLKFVDSDLALAASGVECRLVWDKCTVHTSVLLSQSRGTPPLTTSEECF